MHFRILISTIVILHSIAIISKNTALPTVTKQVSLGNYIPSDLVPFESVKVSRRIVSDLKKLLAAAKKEGHQLKVVSGYRSHTYQKQVFERFTQKELKNNPSFTRAQAEAKANEYSARPGHSEHQLGTAVDILSHENGYQFSSDPKLHFIQWLEKNCQKYNFHIRYPQGNNEYIYEPWHLRWHDDKAR